jgi:hypothetical protein
MRVYARRHRVIPGDRLVVRPNGDDGREFLTLPIKETGPNTVLLEDGSMWPFPDGKGCEVERPEAKES